MRSRESLRALQVRVCTWADRTFPRSTPKTILKHLKEEVRELCKARGIAKMEEEAADVVLLLLHFCHKRAFCLEDAARRKFAVNQRRIWGKPAADGSVRHVERPIRKRRRR